MVVISDTSPIANLIQINRLILLNQLFDSIIVPPSVHSEILKLEDFGFTLNIYREAHWITVKAPTDKDKVDQLKTEIDQGESEAIALAEELNAQLLIIDERLGTNIAKERGLNTIGLLGLLIKAKDKSIIDAIKPILEELENVGFWMGKRLKARVLEIVNE